MAADPFKAPSSGDQISDHKGRLLLITPLDYKTGIITKFATEQKPSSDAVEADFVVIDGLDGPEEYTGALLFAGNLIRVTKREAQYNATNPNGDPKTGLPRMILGRLARGEDKKGLTDPSLYDTKGDKRPWVLEAPSEADKAQARAYIASLKSQEPDNPFAI